MGFSFAVYLLTVLLFSRANYVERLCRTIMKLCIRVWNRNIRLLFYTHERNFGNRSFQVDPPLHYPNRNPF